MDTHKNAPLTPKGREAMVRSVVEGGLSKASAARQFNVTPKTVAKWFGRFRADGPDGLRDRSSRPHSLPGQTPAATCAAVETLRRRRYTGKQIASELGISHATVSRILRRLGLNRLAALEPSEPVRARAAEGLEDPQRDQGGERGNEHRQHRGAAELHRVPLAVPLVDQRGQRCWCAIPRRSIIQGYIGPAQFRPDCDH